MSEKSWNSFKDSLNTFFNIQTLPLANMSKDVINKTWNFWSAKIKETMNKHIPYAYTAPKLFFALLLKATKLHSALKHINKCLHILSNNSLNNLTKVNHHLSKTATLA